MMATLLFLGVFSVVVVQVKSKQSTTICVKSFELTRSFDGAAAIIPTITIQQSPPVSLVLLFFTLPKNESSSGRYYNHPGTHNIHWQVCEQRRRCCSHCTYVLVKRKIMSLSVYAHIKDNISHIISGVNARYGIVECMNLWQGFCLHHQ